MGRHGPTSQSAFPQRALAIRTAGDEDGEGRKVQETPGVRKVTNFSGARFPSVGVLFPCRGAESRFLDQRRSGVPTPQIASPRRDLAIRGGDDKIKEGLQQNDTKVRVEPIQNLKRTPPLPISGKKTSKKFV